MLFEMILAVENPRFGRPTLARRMIMESEVLDCRVFVAAVDTPTFICCGVYRDWGERAADVTLKWQMHR
jgi:hypothetical protein